MNAMPKPCPRESRDEVVRDSCFEGDMDTVVKDHARAFLFRSPNDPADASQWRHSRPIADGTTASAGRALVGTAFRRHDRPLHDTGLL